MRQIAHSVAQRRQPRDHAGGWRRGTHPTPQPGIVAHFFLRLYLPILLSLGLLFSEQVLRPPVEGWELRIRRVAVGCLRVNANPNLPPGIRRCVRRLWACSPALRGCLGEPKRTDPTRLQAVVGWLDVRPVWRRWRCGLRWSGDSGAYERFS